MNDMDKLRQHMFSMMEGLRKGTVKVPVAKAMSEGAQVLINSVKVELEARKQAGSKQLPSFLPTEVPQIEETDVEASPEDDEENESDAEYYNSLLPVEAPSNITIHRARS